MTQYIDKAALVAEIENKIKKYTKRGEESDAKRDGYGMYWGGVLSCLNEIRTLCDTLEVKEIGVDLGDPKGDVEVKTAWTDLEEVAIKYGNCFEKHSDLASMAFIKGAMCGKEQAEIQIKAQSMALAHGCPKEEPVSEDLEKAASQYPSVIRTISPQWESELENAFKAGAEWKKEQFEKNRIEQCDNITEEQYNLENGFIDQYIDKHHCIPTFLGAIEYGMEKQKGKMIDKATEWLEEHLLDFWSQRITNTDYFIEEFKKAMGE